LAKRSTTKAKPKPSTKTKPLPRLGVLMPREDARALYLDGAAMSPVAAEKKDGDKSGGESDALDMIERLGFVQVDSINIVERAHHHILWSRLPGYRPSHLDVLQRSGRVFEHWTHDASMIPTGSFPHWKHRFARVAWGDWIRRKLGRGGRKLVEGVLARIEREGPLTARDFEHPGRKSGAWWDWKPSKAALEFLWRSGELAIAGRDGFEKIYDLTSRVLGESHAAPMPASDEHIDWLCRGALDRLGAATVRDLELFWHMTDRTNISRWCRERINSGELVEVRVDRDDRTAVAYAFADWPAKAQAARERLQPHHELGDRAGPMRILSPFDPIVRDRDRCSRLFGFEYRFEAFVPEPKRKYGYYVLPVLQGDRFVARLDPKLERVKRQLIIKNIWWEPREKSPRAVKLLRSAVQEYATFLGADEVIGP
jgi:uncharacterized protein